MRRNPSGIKRFFQVAIPVVLIILAILVISNLVEPREVPSNSTNVVVDGNNAETPTPVVTPTLPNTDNEEPVPEDDKEDTEIPNTLIDHDVPFTAQAPTGQWSDERQQDGCEEASALMAIRWVKNQGITKQQALEEITTLSDYEQATYGEYRDVTLADVKKWIFNDYYKYSNVKHVKNITKEDIIRALHDNSVVLLPMNGQLLGNPNFTAPGPERHMLLVRGYDPRTDQFITNDPGTRKGESYRYSSATIMNAILVYPTGYHVPANESLKEMLVVKK